MSMVLPPFVFRRYDAQLLAVLCNDAYGGIHLPYYRTYVYGGNPVAQ